MWSSNFFGLYKPDSDSFRRTCLALALSILAHLLVLGGLEIRLPLIDPAEHVVEVRLAAPEIVPEPVPQPLEEPVKIVESVPSPRPVPKPEPEAPIADLDAVPEVAQEEVEPVEPESVTEPATERAELVPEVLQEQASDPVLDEQIEDDEPVAQGLITNRQAYIETDFDLKQGGGVVGTSHISFRQLADGSYSITSTTEAKGLLSIFLRGQLVQTSEGQVTERGLRPLQFKYTMTSREEKSRFAHFDWQAEKLHLQGEKGAKTAALPEGAQDLLSFMYQFVFVPPLEHMEIPITNGKKLDTYSYVFDGEEEFMTPVGNLRTLHITHHGKDTEKTELWLAVDYKYMPVKIRKTEEDGSVVEQTVTKLSTDFLN